MSNEASLLTRDARVCWHPFTQHALERDFLPVVAARDAVLTLADGREVIDAISSWWSCLHGHGQPEIAEAIAEQAARLDHVLFAGATHEPAVRLAERLVDRTPAGLDHVFYSDNGSTSVEVALKMVYQSWVHRGEPGRSVFVALEGSYHGDTVGAMSVGDPDPFFEYYRPLLFEVRHAPVDATAVAEALDDLGARAAGVILEPLVQGAGGMLMQPTALLQEVRKTCDERGLPLIADEVMTGFGRTGAWFACEKAGIAPDVLCLAKGLTGGTLPLSATLATSALFEAFLAPDRHRAFIHGHTFTANPIGCAAGLASLDLAERNDVPRQLDEIGGRIEEALAPLRDDRRVRELRRTGGIVALELEPPAGEAAGYWGGSVLQLRARSVERGVLLRPLGNVLYAMPPACTTPEQCDHIATVMRELVTASLGGADRRARRYDGDAG